MVDRAELLHANGHRNLHHNWQSDGDRRNDNCQRVDNERREKVSVFKLVPEGALNAKLHEHNRASRGDDAVDDDHDLLFK